MTTEKELTIQFLRQEAPDFYKMMAESGKLEKLPEEELIHLYASSITAPIVDISDVSDDELPPPNLKMIENALKKAKELDKCNKPHSLNFFIMLRRTAMAASILLCIGLGLNVLISSDNREFLFSNETSQETTDYAVRVRGASAAELIFRDELDALIKEVVSLNISKAEGKVTCTVKPDKNQGNIVWIIISAGDKFSSGKILLTTKKDVKKQLFSIIPNMLE